MVGASPQTDARFTLTEAGGVVEFLRTQIPRPAAPIRSGADVEPRIRPLDNPVNARVLAARVMAMLGARDQPATP